MATMVLCHLRTISHYQVFRIAFFTTAYIATSNLLDSQYFTPHISISNMKYYVDMIMCGNNCTPATMRVP